MNNLLGRAIFLALLTLGLTNSGPYLATLQAATPAIVQTGDDCVGDSSANCTLSDTASGNLIVVYIWTGTNRTVSTVTDDDSNTYEEAESDVDDAGSSNSWQVSIWFAKNIAGGAGTLTITATANAGGEFIFAQAVEVSGADTSSPLDQTGINDSTSSTNNHTCSGAVTTAAEVYVGCAAAFNGNDAGPFTEGSGYTEFQDNGQQIFGQHRVSAGSLVSETGQFTGAGEARQGTAVLASFKSAGGGGGGSTPKPGLLLGVGEWK